MTPTASKEQSESGHIKYTYATGRRKSAVARVRVFPGTGAFSLNNTATEIDQRLTAVLELVGKKDKLDISAHVTGGGHEGQIMAIRLGLARSLCTIDSNFRAVLKKAGLLTRDPREKERKKFGLHSARRGPQFSKR